VSVEDMQFYTEEATSITTNVQFYTEEASIIADGRIYIAALHYNKPIHRHYEASFDA
jgi:hypothetical protein